MALVLRLFHIEFSSFGVRALFKPAFYFIAFCFILSCSESEIAPCPICALVTESNQTESQFKCLGLAHRYPRLQEISRENLGEVCDPKAEGVVTGLSGCGDPWTVRTFVDCR